MYNGMMTHLDKNVGKVVDALKETAAPNAQVGGRAAGGEGGGKGGGGVEGPTHPGKSAPSLPLPQVVNTSEGDEASLWDNTILVFMSDNGGPIYWNKPSLSGVEGWHGGGGSNNYPLRGGKISLLEGGLWGLGVGRLRAYFSPPPASPRSRAWVRGGGGSWRIPHPSPPPPPPSQEASGCRF